MTIARVRSLSAKAQHAKCALRSSLQENCDWPNCWVDPENVTERQALYIYLWN